jgi:hypothetical protein
VGERFAVRLHGQFAQGKFGTLQRLALRPEGHIA